MYLKVVVVGEPYHVAEEDFNIYLVSFNQN